MKPKSKGGVKAAGVKRKKQKITPQMTVDDMFSMITDDLDDDASVSQGMMYTVITLNSLVYAKKE